MTSGDAPDNTQPSQQGTRLLRRVGSSGGLSINIPKTHHIRRPSNGTPNELPTIAPPDYQAQLPPPTPGSKSGGPGGLTLDLGGYTSTPSSQQGPLTPDLPTPVIEPPVAVSQGPTVGAAVTQMSPIDTYNLMSTQPAASNKYAPLMILDVRSKERYNQMHIESALSVPLEAVSDDPNIISGMSLEAIIDMCSEEVRHKFQWHAMHRIIVYGSNAASPSPGLLNSSLVPQTPSSAHIDSSQQQGFFFGPSRSDPTPAMSVQATSPSPACVTLAMALQSQRTTRSVHILTGPEEFCSQFPFLTIVGSDQSGSLTFEKQHPSLILPQLFLGTFANACNEPVLRHLGITHIVNCAQECKYPEQFSGIDYTRFNLADHPDDSIDRHFENAHNHLDAALAQGPHTRVLVHCHMGQSRAAALTISYIMKRHQLKLDDALDFVKRRREIVSPNPGFLFQLHDFQKHVLNGQD